jgi:hypothetical protein
LEVDFIATASGDEERAMTTRMCLFAIVSTLLFVGVAGAQHPLLDMIANKVVHKYQQSTCEQLLAEKAKKKGQPKPAKEQEAIQKLRSDPQLSAEFINIVAAPIANKMFQCGMIP